MRQIIGGLAQTFAAHKIGLGSFRMEGDAAEPASAAATVRLGRFGIYKFKFDQVQASLNGFDDEDLEGMISVIEKGNNWVRKSVEEFSFKTHAFIYSSHSALSDGTSSSFLLSLPPRSVPVLGEDLGSGFLKPGTMVKWMQKCASQWIIRYRKRTAFTFITWLSSNEMN